MKSLFIIFICLAFFLGKEDAVFSTTTKFEPTITLADPVSTYKGETPQEVLKKLKKIEKGEEVGNPGFSQCLLSKAWDAKRFLQEKAQNLYNSLPLSGKVKVYIGNKAKELSVLAARKIIEDIEKNGVKRMMQAACFISGAPIPDEFNFAWNVMVIEEAFKSSF